MKYDDVSWHLNKDFPKDSPEEYAAAHMALYLKWCFLKGWVGKLHKGSPEDQDKLMSGEMTATDYLYNNCDGKFSSDDLNEEGDLFTLAYYRSDRYQNDYKELTNNKVFKASEEEVDFEKLSRKLDSRLQEFENGDWKNDRWRKIISIVQFLGGLCGVIFLLSNWNSVIGHNTTQTDYVISAMVLLFVMVIYLLSIIAGILLWKRHEKGIMLSQITLSFQLIHIIATTFIFQIIVGASVTLGFNLEPSFGISFNGLVSSDAVIGAHSAKNLYLGVNLYALYALIQLSRLKKSISND